MERSRYSIKPNSGKDLDGFITNFRIADEFDPAWLDSNPDLGITGCAERVAHMIFCDGCRGTGWQRRATLAFRLTVMDNATDRNVRSKRRR